jgi:hypothetical protein
VSFPQSWTRPQRPLESEWSTSQLPKNKAGGVLIVPNALLEYLHTLTSESRMDAREQRREVCKNAAVGLKRHKMAVRACVRACVRVSAAISDVVMRVL